MEEDLGEIQITQPRVFKTRPYTRICVDRWREANPEEYAKRQAIYCARYRLKNAEITKLKNRLSQQRTYHRKMCGCGENLEICMEYNTLLAKHAEEMRIFRENSV
jgi:hypothetical protein